MSEKLKISSPKSRANQKPQRVVSPMVKQLIRGFLVIILLAIVLVIVWYGTRIDSMQIKRIEVTGGFTIPHSLLEEKAWREIDGTYLGLVPKSFVWFYPKEKITMSLQGTSRIKQTALEIVDKNTLTILFDEYVPFALWCQSENDDTCLFIDHTGYAFSEAPNLTGSAFIRFVRDDDEPVLNEEIFPSELIDSTNEFAMALQNDLGLYVTHIKMVGTYDIDFLVAGGGEIKISQAKSFEKSLKDLKIILNSEEFVHLEPGNFQYIDLRFGDKVFINEEFPETVGTTSTSTN
ncbi:hypothetical protein KC845_03265 [Candidatus Kaiserbacteria bacterium]|nr:hypothetical protein [Candidatus Kaiserbacteria bacterium]